MLGVRTTFTAPHDTPWALHTMKLWQRQLLVAVLALCSLGRSWAIDAGTLDRLLPLADQSNRQAQYHVGMLYNNGIGGAPKDPRQAFDWFLKSAQGGDPLGAYKAGCYFAGQFGTVAMDNENALHWKQLAADAGYSLAQYDVGGMYAKAGDHAKAKQWWKSAADQGFAPAAYQYALALGQEADGSKVEALAYLRIARALAPRSVNASALALQDTWMAGMSHEDRAIAQAIATAWRPLPSPLSTLAASGSQAIDALLASSPAS
ncbi:MAG: hypothetical protein CFE44_00385 [Burkholderiales bacterium PBB4]|nr:MAG: hypothetical protein CFE44_00385 [Burkholderiales bacterium PBB4]